MCLDKKKEERKHYTPLLNTFRLSVFTSTSKIHLVGFRKVKTLLPLSRSRRISTSETFSSEETSQEKHQFTANHRVRRVTDHLETRSTVIHNR